MPSDLTSKGREFETRPDLGMTEQLWVIRFTSVFLDSIRNE